MDSVDAPVAGAQPAASAGSYRKGEESKRRILLVALRAFGASGFKGATTRQIADEAKVNLPALKYYFGGKEGLYLACAREIVARYETELLAPLTKVAQELEAGMDGEAARARLKVVMNALIDLQVSDETEPGMAFALREMTEPGPAFDMLFDSFWGPGVELITALISRILGEKIASEPSRLQALLLLSSLSGFSIGRPIALRSLRWPDTRDGRIARIREAVETTVDQIGRG